jgi:hypothetical protein
VELPSQVSTAYTSFNNKKEYIMVHFLDIYDKLVSKVCTENVIFEGYNYVGKTSLINRLSMESTAIIIGKQNTDIIPESIRWSYLLSIMSMTDRLRSNVFLNRSVLSATFFNEYRHPEIKQLISLDTLESFRKLFVEHNYILVLIKNDDFKKILKDKYTKEINDGYNEFNTHILKCAEFLGIDVYIYNNEVNE